MNFDKLTAYLDQLKEKQIPGCDMVIWVDHKEVYRHFTGEAKPGLPMTGHEQYWLYSLTKLVTLSVVMRMNEMGVLSIREPVSRYLPAFGSLAVRDGEKVRPARTVMTIEHLLAMQGGLGSTFDTPGIEHGMQRYGGRATTVQMAECMAEDPLYFDPGQGFRYGLCHDVAGAVASAAAGKPLSTLADELILRPLGMEDVTFHPDSVQMERLAAIYRMQDGVRIEGDRYLNDICSMQTYDSGGGGLMGNVNAFIRLADALANGGVGENGARILKAETIENIRTNRQCGKSMEDFKRVRHKRGYGYGLGVRTLLDPTTSRSPVGEFGWDGAAGAWALMDPQNRVAAVYAQHVIDYLDTYYVFHPTIRDLMYEGLGL